MGERITPAQLFHETVGRGIASIRENFAYNKLAELETGDHFPLPRLHYFSQLANADPKKISKNMEKLMI